MKRFDKCSFIYTKLLIFPQMLIIANPSLRDYNNDILHLRIFVLKDYHYYIKEILQSVG